MENKAARQYLAHIRRALVCGKSDRCRLLERCMAMIDDFQQENPGVGYDGIVAAFGDPVSFAAELLSGLDEPKVEAAKKQRRWIRLAALLAVFTIFLTVLVLLYVRLIRTEALNEHIIVVEHPPHTFTDEEMEQYLESRMISN